MLARFRRISSLIALTVVLAACAVAQTADRLDAATEQKIQDLLSRMTVEEKLGQLSQFSSGQPQLTSSAGKGLLGSALNVTGAAETNAIQRVQLQNSRHKIPVLFGHDVIHGFRTIFPIPLGIASTWDPALAELTARIAAKEARAAGVHWTFSPMVDIARDPRWGRIAEGAGEDPYLGSAFARAFVRGYQGETLNSSETVLACAKHFVGYGAAEAGRDYNTTDMSEQRLRDLYLPPFKAAVDSGVGTLMSAFNSLNGVPTSANAHTLNDILRSEWQFKGFVVSDYKSVEEVINHGFAVSPNDAALKAIKAGVDMEMVSETYATLGAAVKDGTLPEPVLNEAVRRILRIKFQLGLFDKPYADESKSDEGLSKENLQVARNVAQKSIVLLKNQNGLLPLTRKPKTIALIGPLANNKAEMLGSWPARGKAEECVTVLEGIRAKLASTTRVLHVPGTDIRGGSTKQISAAVAAARSADVAILVLGEAAEMSGEAASRTSLNLPGAQQHLLEAVVKTGKPVVLVVMSGRPLTIAWADKHVSAIIQAWFLGTQSGNAIADVLFGDVNPSGKLPITFPRNVGQIPIYYAQLRTGRPFAEADKFTTKYIDSPNTPLYPFGHGLSYTKFAYSNIAVSSSTLLPGNRVIVSADVQNVGKSAGEEVVQFYLGDPVASVARPVRELKGFQRVLLAPGEQKRVEFVVTSDLLGFWSAGGQYVVEPGLFEAWIGTNSAADLKTTFELVQQ